MRPCHVRAIMGLATRGEDVAPLAGLRVALTTIGCKLNQADSDHLRRLLQKEGHVAVEDAHGCDVHVINTCTVTSRADRDCRKAIRRARRAAPGALVVVVGCLAETAEAALRAMPDVDWVVHRGAWDALAGALRLGVEPRGVDESTRFMPREVGSARARAQLVVQDGCDRHCAYCKVPLARGSQRSLVACQVIRECQALAARGYREVVLVGCNLGAWGEDTGEGTLAGLLGQLLDHDLPRLRLSSIEPDSVTDELVGVLRKGAERICPALHIAQQSGSPEVLEGMGRTPDVAGLEAHIERLRQAVPHYGIGYDLLAGFPGEGPEEFEETVAFVERTRPSNLHVFPYSPREGTAAWALGDPIPAAEKRRRVRYLIELGQRLRAEALRSHLGVPAEVVVDRVQPGSFSGLTGTYLRARGRGRACVGDLVTLRPTQILDGELSE